MKPLLLLLLVCFCAACRVIPSETNPDAQVDSLIIKTMDSLSVPGMAVAVVRNGEAIKISAYGYANLEWNTKATIHTNFQTASCTKLFVSTLFAKAIADNKINPNDPLSKYLDSIPHAWNNVRMKHLFNHTSGIRHFDGMADLSTEDVIHSLADSTLEYESGTCQRYAQVDFMIAAFILEKIYMKPLPQLLHDEVCSPLNMNDGGYDSEINNGTFSHSGLISQRASNYYTINGKIQSYKYHYPGYFNAAAGYYASIEDIARWAVGLDNQTLLIKEMQSYYFYNCDSTTNSISEFTRMGWVHGNENGIRYAGHSGGPGLCDVIRFPDEGYTFIVMSNDGELLPGTARAIASVYIHDLPAAPQIQTFDRQ